MLRFTVILALFAAATQAEADGGGRYLETETYLEASFRGEVPSASTLWLRGELRNKVEQVLGHGFPALRVRYWHKGTRSVWILDEIGKEQPITIGVTVADDVIASVRILEFRESRGWEVRYPFFTDQFSGAALNADSQLDSAIDGITGATLSVQAVTRIARVALLLHEHIERPG